MALPHVVLGVLPPAPVERNYTPPHLKHRPASLAEMRAENLTPDSNCNFCGAIDTMIRKLVEAKLPSITQLGATSVPNRCPAIIEDFGLQSLVLRGIVSQTQPVLSCRANNLTMRGIMNASSDWRPTQISART